MGSGACFHSRRKEPFFNHDEFTGDASKSFHAVQDILNQTYIEYKLSKGYTPDQIINKSSSLKSVLEPFSSKGNLDLLKRAGFKDTICIFKYACFEGILAIK